MEQCAQTSEGSRLVLRGAAHLGVCGGALGAALGLALRQILALRLILKLCQINYPLCTRGGVRGHRVCVFDLQLVAHFLGLGF